MSRGSRWGRRCFALGLAAAIASGCASSNPEGTHEPALLDIKVTAERVHAALRKAGPEFRHVEVDASRDGIALTGSVASGETRSRAEEIAKEVNPGVSVSNRVSVR